MDSHWQEGYVGYQEEILLFSEGGETLEWISQGTFSCPLMIFKIFFNPNSPARWDFFSLPTHQNFVLHFPSQKPIFFSTLRLLFAASVPKTCSSSSFRSHPGVLQLPSKVLFKGIKWTKQLRPFGGAALDFFGFFFFFQSDLRNLESDLLILDLILFSRKQTPQIKLFICPLLKPTGLVAR